MTPAFDENYKKREWLSVSDLIQFKKCPRSFFFKTGCHFSMGSHAAPEFGTAMHNAFPIAITQGLEPAIAAFKEVWGDRDADPARNNETAYRILSDYVAAEKSRIYKLIKPPPSLKYFPGTNDWEIPFLVDIGLHVPFAGRLDGLCRLVADDTLWVLDYKTTSQLTGRFFEAFEHSPQMIGYTLYTRLAIPEEKCCGVIIDAVRVSFKNSETQASPIWIHDHQIDGFIKWAQKISAEIKWCEDNKEFPQDWSGCHPYSQFGSHGYMCDFHPLCNVHDWTVMKGIVNVEEERPYSKMLHKEEQEGIL